MPDPDAGLTVESEFGQSLLAIQQRRATGASSISAAEVAERLGIPTRSNEF
ncbi:MAG: hypothetical protein HC840_18185 [Leptolyngbyaceae cyanobacterium RM2_2_4]|nr:hypothetical protein [Leptolyngbyaceae cyanobacterium SM1_4_3]NJO51055.1 hypothetical protein [Leptolyngbyaceae cyanobacterium RM2_2_4]